MLFDIYNLNFQLNSYIVPVIDMQPLLSLTMTKTNKKRPPKPKLSPPKTKQNNPAADYIIFGRLCSTILPWYVLHIDFKVFVCLGLLLPIFY